MLDYYSLSLSFIFAENACSVFNRNYKTVQRGFDKINELNRHQQMLCERNDICQLFLFTKTRDWNKLKMLRILSLDLLP